MDLARTETCPVEDLLTPTTLVVLAVGFASGVLAALLGVGGAVLTTPAIRFLGASPIAAVGSTVPAILPGAISGTLRYRKEGYVRWRIAWTCGLAGVGFALVGAWVAGQVDARWLMVFTAALVAWSGWQLLAGARRTRQRERPAAPADPAMVLLVALGATAGFLAGLLGVGGGVILTPGLALFGALSIKESIATSLVAVAMMSVTALAAHTALGHIDWSFALPLVIGVIPGARVGSRITVRASERTMRLICGVAFLILAVVFAAREVAGLAAS